MFESKAGILFIAGIGFFALAFLSNALVPVLMYQDLPEREVLAELTANKPSTATVDEAGNWLVPLEVPKEAAGLPKSLVKKGHKWVLLVNTSQPAKNADKENGEDGEQDAAKEKQPPAKPAQARLDRDGNWLIPLEIPPNTEDLARELVGDAGSGWKLKIMPKPADKDSPVDVNTDDSNKWAIERGLVVGNKRIAYQFEELSRRYEGQFKKYYGEPSRENLAAALRLGRQIYIGEGCWHCHSQFVRPVSNESRRWGPVASTKEYQNELQRPVMFGTRRVGPDLSRQGGRHGNDWHAVHFFKPKMVSPNSPMPEYPWFYDGSPDKPNRRGLAIIVYVQWLGSWLDSYPYYEELDALDSEEF